MKRRDFLQTSLVAAGLSTLATVANRAAAEPVAPSNAYSKREFYELRTYHLRRGKQPKLLADFFQNAAIPALRRAGAGPVGVFNTTVGPDSPSTHVLITYPSLDALTQVSDALDRDEEYQKAGAEFLNAPFTEPAFERVESRLMRSFTGMPSLVVPAKAAVGKQRLYEIRTYESHSRKANLSKIGMFNDSEMAIFKRVGLEPVFFGENLIGNGLPSLTYLLSYDDSAAHDAQWRAFSTDAEWKKLSSLPGFTDGENVSSISNSFLKAASCSQI